MISASFQMMPKPSPMSWAEESWMHLMVQITGSAESLCPAFQPQCWVLCQLTLSVCAFPSSCSLSFLPPLHASTHHSPFSSFSWPWSLASLTPLLAPTSSTSLFQWWNRFRPKKRNGFREQHCNGVNHQSYPRIRCFCKGRRTLPSFIFHGMGNDQDLKMVFTHSQF